MGTRSLNEYINTVDFEKLRPLIDQQIDEVLKVYGDSINKNYKKPVRYDDLIMENQPTIRPRPEQIYPIELFNFRKNFFNVHKEINNKYLDYMRYNTPYKCVFKNINKLYDQATGKVMELALLMMGLYCRILEIIKTPQPLLVYSKWLMEGLENGCITTVLRDLDNYILNRRNKKIRNINKNCVEERQIEIAFNNGNCRVTHGRSIIEKEEKRKEQEKKDAIDEIKINMRSDCKQGMRIVSYLDKLKTMSEMADKYTLVKKIVIKENIKKMMGFVRRMIMKNNCHWYMKIKKITVKEIEEDEGSIDDIIDETIEKEKEVEGLLKEMKKYVKNDQDEIRCDMINRKDMKLKELEEIMIKAKELDSKLQKLTLQRIENCSCKKETLSLHNKILSRIENKLNNVMKKIDTLKKKLNVHYVKIMGNILLIETLQLFNPSILNSTKLSIPRKPVKIDMQPLTVEEKKKLIETDIIIKKIDIAKDENIKTIISRSQNVCQYYSIDPGICKLVRQNRDKNENSLKLLKQLLNKK